MLQPASGRQRDDLGIAQARQMVEGGHPLTYIVPDMAVQNTAHLLEVVHR